MVSGVRYPDQQRRALKLLRYRDSKLSVTIFLPDVFHSKEVLTDLLPGFRLDETSRRG